MKVLTNLIARILFAIPFLVFGIMHFAYAGNMAGMVPIPGGVYWIYFTGVAQIAAAVAIVSGYQARLASLLVALLMVIYIVAIHVPGMGNEATAQMSMSNLLKDLGIAGGALAIANIFGKK
jgi:uncharacterized membrane protein YphA (DoxX/SURF4 family)